MRILQIIPHYVPAYRFGGPLQVAHSLGKALVKAGHVVTVCTTNLANESTILDTPIDQPVDVDGVSVYYEPTILFHSWGFSSQLVRRIRKEVAKADIVFIHAHYQFANWAGAIIARLHHKPYIIFAHGSLHIRGIQNKNHYLKQLYLRLLEDKNFRAALFIAFNAPEEQTNSLYNELGKVIPSGIDPKAFMNLPKPGAFRRRYPALTDKTLCVFLGRLDIEQKGLDLLILAIAMATDRCPHLHLVLAGPDEDGGKQRLEALATANNIRDKITFTGLIHGDDKLALLQDANFFVLTSRFEGLSIALLEALYMGLPILVTDQVGLSTEIKRLNAGIVVPPTVEAISEALFELSNMQVRIPMQNAGKKFLDDNYTWDAIASKFIDSILSQLIKK